MKSPSRQPAEHDHERAPQRRQQDPQRVRTVDAGSAVALVRSLQRSVGNQAVNTILRQYDLQQRSARASSADLGRKASSQAARAGTSLQREMINEDEEIQLRSCDALQRAMIDEDEEIQLRSSDTAQRAMIDEDEDIQLRSNDALQRAMIDEDEDIQMKPEVGSQGGQVSDGVAARIQARRGSGESFSGAARTRMESAFGTSFDGVRLHTDGESSALNHSVNAVAFTTGNDIFFRNGAYQPNTSDGQNLLAHELTHVVQQRSMSGSGPMTVRPAGDSFELEADAMASSISRRFDDASELS
jgi:hypothetical protein